MLARIHYTTAEASVLTSACHRCDPVALPLRAGSTLVQHKGGQEPSNRRRPSSPVAV